MTRKAFTAVLVREGFGVGVAAEDEAGYWPLPDHGTFKTWDGAQAEADRLNEGLGLTKVQAWHIVASSMNRGVA